MNAPERNMVRLAVGLFALGVAVRVLPWKLPSIESFQVGEAMAVEAVAVSAETDSIPVVLDKVTIPEERAKGGKKPPKVRLPVHVNSASVDELCALNGVGPKLAEKIVGFREASGPFKTPSDLQKVPGIGKKKLEKLLPSVIFD